MSRKLTELSDCGKEIQSSLKQSGMIELKLSRLCHIEGYRERLLIFISQAYPKQLVPKF